MSIITAKVVLADLETPRKDGKKIRLRHKIKHK